MSLGELLKQIQAADIELWADGDRLRYSAPKGALTPALRASLSEHKMEILASLQVAARAAAPGPLLPLTREGDLPLSFAQQRLWFLAQLEPDNPAYNVTGAVQLSGPLQVAALQQSLHALVQRHEPLRTTFVNVAGQPRQVIAPARTHALPVIDLSRLPAARQEALVQQLARQDFMRPFDLASGPLVRTGLLRLHPAEHVLLLNMHHIASDGWSMGIVVKEVGLLYQAFLRGESSPLPALPLQYADYAAWQRKWLQGEVLETQIAYWRAQLTNAPVSIPLPIDYPPAREPGFQGDVFFFDLPAVLSQNLTALSRQEGVTLFTTLLAAFQALLARYTGQRDIVVSTRIAGRNRSELEGLIGFFVNTLVIRADCTGNPPFRELLRRVQQAVLGAFTHQDLPFEQLIEQLKPPRTVKRTPFDQVVFVMQNAPMEPLDLADLRLRFLRISNHSAKSELTLFVHEDASGLKGILEYSSDLFDLTTIQRLAEHYLNLLTEISRDCTQQIENLAFLGAVERAQLLSGWNATAEDFPGERRVHEIFEAQARRTPHAVAVSSQGAQVTYQVLNERANQLAHFLRSTGAGPETHVGLFLERSLEQVVALLAVLKAGAVSVPLDVHSPPQRLAFLFTDARFTLLLTHSALRDRLPAAHFPCPVLCLDSEWAGSDSQAGPAVVSSVRPLNLAYIIYTSGSTGQPKGVMISQLALLNHMLWMQGAFPLAATDRILQKTSFSFDASVWEFYAPLLTGACLVLARPEDPLDSRSLVETLLREQISIVQVVPTMLRILLDESAFAPGHSLRRVFCGGEELRADLHARVQALPGAQLPLFHLYGPTECTVNATAWVCKRESQGQRVPIGRPIANTQVYVLDAHLALVPIGVPGELSIAGEQLARGYLNHPERTAECFIPNPYSTVPGARLYRTGDLVRWRSDGQLEFLGRVDRQIKLRGLRIEPGEIEASIARHPLVSDQLVVARPTTAGDTRLIAYIVPKQEQSQALTGSADQVAHWQVLYDTLYSQLSLQRDPLFNFAGWNSAYTNEPIAEQDMRRWAAQTAERILRLKPQRILEIGCGAGLLLWRLASSCTYYHGTDMSAQAVDYLHRILQQPAYHTSQVRVERREATDFTALEEQGYDLVIVNSVIQYFPGIDYLLRVLEGALRTVRPGGHLFIGDVRHLHLLKTFHTSVQLSQAPPALDLSELRQRIQQRTVRDPELVLDPAFFSALTRHLPRITHVQIEPRRGYARNELTCFRYDVILTVDGPQQGRQLPVWLPWETQMAGLTDLRRRLMERPAILAVTGIPNARLQSENLALAVLTHDAGLQTVGDLTTALSLASREPGIEIEDLFTLAASLQYTLEVSWLSSGEDGSFDAVFQRRSQGHIESSGVISFPGRTEQHRSWSTYGNNPLQGRLAERLVPELQHVLRAHLPASLVPASFLLLEVLPLLPGGKIDYRALPEPESGRPALSATYLSPRSELERTIASVWQEVLQIEKIGVQDNFFDLGGHSLLLLQVHSSLSRKLHVPLTVIDLFTYPTISALAEYCRQEQSEPAALTQGQQRADARQHALVETQTEAHRCNEIAIIGMAGRFPGARDVEQFWQNIQAGVESIEFFTPDEMIAAGIPPAIAYDPAYVPAVSRLADVDLFDAAFFGYSPREAEMMDPQQRIFLECAWESLENAGYNPDIFPGTIGIYAGSTINTYFLYNVLPHRERIAQVGMYQTLLGNEAAFLTTRVAYKLNLQGPAVNVSTACSTSLVATHMACQSLLHHECDIALAGGVTVGVPQETGYMYIEGMINSPDGHCRAFDARAKGTVGGNGVALVVLKRLEDALRDGDCITAIIKGSAINNDGSQKVGFTAPGVQGQMGVISEALMVAGINPETIGYVEAHGTGTVLGDPIEIAALTQAYRRWTEARGYCAIGSLKSNVGHLDNAAGVAGLIKAARALNENMLPPSLHVTSPNPQIDFTHSPFYVNTVLTPWKTQGTPRRAGVSSFGVGGTNAHVILEEAPAPARSSSSRAWQLLMLSTTTPAALTMATERLTSYLEHHSQVNLADIAYTSQVGRKAFAWRRILVCRDHADALSSLQANSTARLLTAHWTGSNCSPVFLFPGQGTGYVGMGHELYEAEPAFRSQIDLCAQILTPHLGLDLRAVLYPVATQGRQDLGETLLTQVALFVTEYALARLWMSWGVLPRALLGHSLGEYVAACLAGVFSLEDALSLVATRGRLMQHLPRGRMLSVPLSPDQLLPLLGDELALAAINGPALCVASGPQAAIALLQERLVEQQVESQLLHTSHAFHSAMMEPMLSEFYAYVACIPMQAPTLAYLSNVSGTWITAAEATSPAYWTRHLRQTVLFAAGVQVLLQDLDHVFLEVGPGHMLATLVRQQGEQAVGRSVLLSLPHVYDQAGESELLLTTLGRLWLAGVTPDWPAFSSHEQRLRVPLPTYPFARQRYWLPAPQRVGFGREQTTDTQAPARAADEPISVLPAPQSDPEPENDIAGLLLVLWQELLGIEQIGLHANFFELGGHSLMATQLLARLHDIFPVDIPLERLFTAPTIAQFAAVIEESLLGYLESLPDEEAQRLEQR